MKPWLCIILFAVAGASARSTKELKADPEAEAKIAKQLAEIEKELEVVEKLEEQIEKNSTSRDARGLLKKLSFLAGMKMGGLVESQGTLAASNSLRIFGKVMNTALSVSYGPYEQEIKVPHVDDDRIHESQVNKDSWVEVEHNTKSSLATSHHPIHLPSLSNIRQNFVKNHNSLVERVNHKFLKNEASLRSN